MKSARDEEAYPYMTWIGEEVDEAYYKEVMAIEVNPGMDKSDFKIVFLSTTWNIKHCQLERV